VRTLGGPLVNTFRAGVELNLAPEVAETNPLSLVQVGAAGVGRGAGLRWRSGGDQVLQLIPEVTGRYWATGVGTSVGAGGGRGGGGDLRIEAALAVRLICTYREDSQLVEIHIECGVSVRGVSEDHPNLEALARVEQAVVALVDHPPPGAIQRLELLHRALPGLHCAHSRREAQLQVPGRVGLVRWYGDKDLHAS
jgi:hypothetical protein